MPGYKTLTGMGGTGGAADLAESLRQMGRGRDTVLAHITPKEAQMLMQMGGSGTINPNTGLPEFQPFDYEYDAYGATADRTPSPEMIDIGFGPGQFTPSYTREDVRGMEAPQFETFTGYQPMDIGFGPGQFTPEYGPADVAGMAPEQFQRFEAPQPSPFARLAAGAEQGIEGVRGFAREYPNVAKLLSTGAQSLPALLQAARARREGGRAAEELRALGRPLREEAENLRQQALAGGLTPQQAREQEAARARLRQQAATRGATTGTQQAMIESQLQRARSEMGQVNLQNALRQLNLANAYEEEAIRRKIQADQEINDTLGQIFANIGRQSGGTAPTRQPQARLQEQTAPVTRRPEIR